MKTVPDLKELFKQAAEIAQQVPPAMQEAAFGRAIDMLTAGNRPAVKTGKQGPAPPDRGSSPARKGAARGEGVVDQLVAAIDSTQHPGVASASKVLDRALMVLQIALNEFSIDGLSPGEIAAVLTDKFRLNTSAPAVRMALGPATTLVNRVPRGPAYAYRIMGPGEEYLAHLRSTPDQHERVPGASRRQRKRVARASTVAPASDARKSATPRSAARAKRASSPGAVLPRQPRSAARSPKTAIAELIKENYFSDPRSGADVQAYLRKKKALTIDTTQLRVAMLRLVRDRVLDRDENAEGQYEYSKPKS